MDVVTREIVNRITRYFNMGLSSAEIGKLLDLTPRTVQRYLKKYDIRNEQKALPLEEKAYQLVQQGKSYSQVGAIMRVSKTTVYKWMRKRKQAATNPDTDNSPE